MILRRVSRRTPKGEIFDPEVEKARALRDIERVEKRDWQLWILTVSLLIVLTFFIVFNYLDILGKSPRQVFKEFTLLKTFVIASAALILGFCIYILFKNAELRRLRREIFVHKIKL